MNSSDLRMVGAVSARDYERARYELVCVDHAHVRRVGARKLCEAQLKRLQAAQAVVTAMEEYALLFGRAAQ